MSVNIRKISYSYIKFADYPDQKFMWPKDKNSVGKK